MAAAVPADCQSGCVGSVLSYGEPKVIQVCVNVVACNGMARPVGEHPIPGWEALFRAVNMHVSMPWRDQRKCNGVPCRFGNFAEPDDRC